MTAFVNANPATVRFLEMVRESGTRDATSEESESARVNYSDRIWADNSVVRHEELQDLIIQDLVRRCAAQCAFGLLVLGPADTWLIDKRDCPGATGFYGVEVSVVGAVYARKDR